MSLVSNPFQILLYGNKNAQTIAAGAEDLTLNAPINENVITYTPPGIINLVAGHDYKLEALFILNSVNANYFAFWSDLANAPVGIVNAPAIGADGSLHNHAVAIFHPTVDTQVKLRVLTGIGTTFEAETIYSVIALS